MSGDILVVTTVECYRPGMVLNILECRGQPTTKNYPAQNVNSAMAEKTSSTSRIFNRSEIKSGENWFLMTKIILSFLRTKHKYAFSTYIEIYSTSLVLKSSRVRGVIGKSMSKRLLREQ